MTSFELWPIDENEIKNCFFLLLVLAFAWSLLGF